LQNETAARFAAFVEAFVGKSKNITKAFEYIAEDYIVCVFFPVLRTGVFYAWQVSNMSTTAVPVLCRTTILWPATGRRRPGASSARSGKTYNTPICVPPSVTACRGSTTGPVGSGRLWIGSDGRLGALPNTYVTIRSWPHRSCLVSHGFRGEWHDTHCATNY
jgi:hypothetical protein